jgi:DNA-binding NarL/FixJ family response regulator
MLETRVLLVDDHAVLRAGLRLLLEAQPDLRVVGEAGDGREALTLALDQRPDLVLLDLTLPGLSGLETLAALHKVLPTAKVMILTMHDDEGYLRQALRQGARGYVLKKAADTELIAAVRAVLRGDVYVQSAMTAALLDTLLPAQTGPAREDPWQTLTERERETLLLVARGHTSAQIGDQLSLSPKTVETYRARGLEKLRLRSRAALVQFVLARGLLA